MKQPLSLLIPYGLIRISSKERHTGELRATKAIRPPSARRDRKDGDNDGMPVITVVVDGG